MWATIYTLALSRSLMHLSSEILLLFEANRKVGSIEAKYPYDLVVNANMTRVLKTGKMLYASSAVFSHDTTSYRHAGNVRRHDDAVSFHRIGS